MTQRVRRLLLSSPLLIFAISLIAHEGRVRIARAQDPPVSPPPTITGNVKGDGSTPPTGKLFRFTPVPADPDPFYGPHPTVFNVAPATIPTAYPLGIDVVPKDVSPNFNGTTGRSDQPQLFEVSAIVPGKRTSLITGNPNGNYIAQPYFIADQKIVCAGASCAQPINVQLFAKWGTVKGRVLFKDGTPIPRSLRVAAEPKTYPSPAPDNRWHVYLTTTSTAENEEGKYVFTSPGLGSANPLSDQCVSPFTNFCWTIPVDPNNSWALPVLGDGGVDDRDKHYYSNVKGTFEWNVFLSDKYRVNGLKVDSSEASEANFAIDLDDFEMVEQYQQEKRPFKDDSPENDEDPVDCNPDTLMGGGPPAGPHPVSLITGNVFLDQEDVRLPGLRREFVFARAYNSFGAPGRFGWGWSDSFDKRIETMSRQMLRLWGSDGAPMYFTDPDGDGVLRPYGNPDGGSWITASAAGFLRTFRTGGHERYDTNGRLTERADRSGRATTLTYDSFGHATDIVSPEGRHLRLEYNGPAGTVSRVFGPMGLIAEYRIAWGGPEFGGAYELRQVKYADGTGHNFTYDGDHRLLTVADLAGTVRDRHGYDVRGRAVFSELDAGRERHAYDYQEGRTVVTDATGAVSTFEITRKIAGRFVTRVTGCGFCGQSSGTRSWDLDEQGRVTRYVDADNHATLYRWEGSRLVGRTNPLGQETTYADFDEFDRAHTVIVPGRGTTTLTFNALGITGITRPGGDTTTVTYVNQRPSLIQIGNLTSSYDITDLGDIRSFTDTRGKTTHFTYDGMGRVLSMTTALNQTTRFERTAGGRLSAVIRPDGKRAEVHYDASGRSVLLKDEASRSYGRTYDAYGRLAAMSDPIGSTRFAYDVMSRVTELTDALHRTTRFAYDGTGRVRSVTDPADASDIFEYYPSGRLRTRTDRRGTTTTYAYDGLGRPTSIAYSDGTPTLTAAYDDLARTATFANGVDSLTVTLDHAGRILSESSALNSSTVSYSYDENHQLQSLNLNNGTVATYAYDGGYVSAITSSSRQFLFTYDDLERRSTVTFPNGLQTTYEYHPQSDWLTRMVTSSGTSSVWDVSYTHEVLGKPVTKSLAGDHEEYDYDDGARLVGFRRVGATGTATSWQYDAVGNRTHETRDGVPRSMAHDVRNRLLTATGGGLVRVRGRTTEASTVTVDGQPARMLPNNEFEADVPRAPGQVTFTVQARDASGNVRTSIYRVDVAADGTTYTYDPNGNLASRSGTGGSWTYEWNGADQLTRVVHDGVEAARFSYDPFGRRARKVAGGVTYSYVYDGADILRESRSDGTSFTFIQGPAVDEPLARKGATGEWTYYHADGLGSIIRMTDDTGGVVGSMQYDPWGNPESGGIVSGHAFTGREWDSETGLYYYRARYYDPKVGRFLSEDPIRFEGGDINFYAYAWGSPTSLTDPSGLKVRFRGTKAQLAPLKRAYDAVKKTSRGRRLAETLENAEETWTIQPGCNRSDSNPHGRIITIDPNYHPLVMTSDGVQPIPIEANMAHELGHAATGMRDLYNPFFEYMMNVFYNENPVRRELGYPDRTEYLAPTTIP